MKKYFLLIYLSVFILHLKRRDFFFNFIQNKYTRNYKESLRGGDFAPVRNTG